MSDGEAAAIRWGLIGASAIARHWMADAIGAAGGTITAVASRDAERGRSFALACGIARSVTALDALWPEVDAVYISTTNDRHREACLAAAAARKHVLCEKPLATRLADAREMVAACRHAGVVMATNHHLRCGAAHRAMRAAIAAGRIGRPLTARVLHGGALPEHLHGWRLRETEAGAGVILDLTVHDADLLRYLLDDEPETVMAAAQNGGLAAPGIEDAAMGTIAFRSGLLAQFADSFTTPAVRSVVEVHGRAGSIVAWDSLAPAAGGSLVLRTAHSEETVPIAPENAYIRVVRGMHAAIAGQGRPSATGEDGVRSLAVALAALRSAASGRIERVQDET